MARPPCGVSDVIRIVTKACGEARHGQFSRLRRVATWFTDEGNSVDHGIGAGIEIIGMGVFIRGPIIYTGRGIIIPSGDRPRVDAYTWCCFPITESSGVEGGRNLLPNCSLA